MGAAIIEVGGALVSVHALAGAIVVAFGAMCELLGYIWGTSDADDLVGDLLLWYNQGFICSDMFLEGVFKVAEGGNDWIVYCGQRSTKI